MYTSPFDLTGLLISAHHAGVIAAASVHAGPERALARPTLWMVNLVGSVAAVCTTLALVPQLARVWRLKTARDISLLMFMVYSVGELLWLIYGIYIHSMPVIAANAVSLVLALFILWLKLHYGDGNAPLAHHTASAGK